MEELQAFVTDKKFLAGLIIGFTLGALHPSDFNLVIS